jgi:Bacterial type II/III secretion system short domain
MRNVIVIALALIALGTVTCLAEAPAGKAAGRPQWEYQTLSREKITELGKNDFAAGLNKLGDDGWELVAVTLSQDARPQVPSRPAEYYFKRARAAVARDQPRPGVAGPEVVVDQFQVVHLKSATASDLAKTLQSVFGNKGGLVIVADQRTNTLVLRGSPKQIEEILLLIRELDVPGRVSGDSGKM